ncbi:Zn-ribbon domain-containing OB-fold protein [Nocardia sp. NPDC004123]
MTTPLTEQYYAALERGELVIQQCGDCAAPIMYPKYLCPVCGSTDLGWTPAAGGGTLHSFTIQRIGAPTGFEADLPYTLGVVKLDEGVQLLARLRPGADGEWDHYRCDMRVRFDATPDGGRHIAYFVPEGHGDDADS